MNILLINAHPDYTNAARGTNQLQNAALAQLHRANPHAHIETLALYAPEAVIPPVDATVLNHPETAAAAQERIIAQWRRADLVLIFMPLHNFNIVSRLKDYIDNLLIANKTFKYTADGSVGLLDGKQHVAYVQTSGSDYQHDLRYVNADIAPHYLRTILNFMGIKSMTLIRAEGLDLIQNDKQQLLDAAAGQLQQYLAQFAE